jgi:hypothetical protein
MEWSNCPRKARDREKLQKIDHDMLRYRLQQSASRKNWDEMISTMLH